MFILTYKSYFHYIIKAYIIQDVSIESAVYSSLLISAATEKGPAEKWEGKISISNTKIYELFYARE